VSLHLALAKLDPNIAIIRSKQTNVITNADKAKVWKEIIDSVNARAGGQKKIGRANQEKVENTMELWDTIHWLVIHSTIQRLSNVKLSSAYGTTG
jgi:hypothetical protein